jgi:succinylglutamic semialdehyde dehydrogenase
MGPLIRNEEAERIIAAQTSMEQQGGKPLLPMKKELPYLPFVTPGIMDVTAIESRGDDEYFAPFLQVIRVKNFDAAIAEANQTAYGLAAAIFTADAERYARFRLESRAGLINWNRQTTGASGALPFGGTGISGNHRPAGYYAADYCAYPVASLESESLTLPESLSPGMKLE